VYLRELIRSFSFTTKQSVRSLITIFIILLFFYPYCYNLAVGQKTDAHETGEFNFAIAGDFGCNEEARKIIDAIKSKQPKLVIALGDLAYKKNPACWLDMISPLDNDKCLMTTMMMSWRCSVRLQHHHNSFFYFIS
jgi:hypothetical protein